MTSITSRIRVSPLTAAALFAGAALLLGGCSTAPVAKQPSEKPVTYIELHRQMLRLAETGNAESTPGSLVTLPARSTDLGGAASLATNP
jgi:hypothetical protein